MPHQLQGERAAEPVCPTLLAAAEGAKATCTLAPAESAAGLLATNAPTGGLEGLLEEVVSLSVDLQGRLQPQGSES